MNTADNLQELFNDMGEYKKAKELFVDSETNEYYVALGSSRVAYAKLVNSLKNPFKIILVYGSPGTGKSYILQKFYDNFKDKLNIFFFKEPIFNKETSLKNIYKNITGKELDPLLDDEGIFRAFEKDVKNQVYIILDEAQLYDTQTLEWIRILSNQNSFKFVISVHRIDKEHILAQKHFQTRAFEIIEFNPLSEQEVEEYIRKKLLLGEQFEVLDMLGRGNYKLIYKYTKGILRDINRLMYRLLELVEYKKDEAMSFFTKKLKNSFIEIAALDLKMG